MKLRTTELTGAALDWAVAKCESKDTYCEIHAGNILYGRVTSGFVQFRPSTNWSQGGPIIEREGIDLDPLLNENNKPEHWCAFLGNHDGNGATPLIAAMRCYVASKLGEEVEVPDELA